MSLPPITIVMTTYFPPGEIGARRAAAAKDTIETWRDHLRYGAEIQLHIADDGSAPEYQRAVIDRAQYLFTTITTSRQERHGVGASLNAGCRKAFEESPDGLVLYAVDDWTLTAPFDLTLWAEMIGPAGLGCLRLGPPHPHLTGRIQHWDEGEGGNPGLWYLVLERHHFAFGHRPALYHRRLFEHYGWFTEDVNAYECERLYAVKINNTLGPGIGLALHHPWIPIAEEPELELAGIDPRDG